MGAYLSQPVKEKESSDGGNARVKFGTSAMQGWRTSMEVRPPFELVFKAFVFCVGVGGGVRRQHFLPWSSFGRGFFFFQATKKLRKQKMKELLLLFFCHLFFPFVVPRMDGCLSSSFVVVLSQNTACSHVLVFCVSSLPPFDASTGFALRGTRLGRGDVFLCRV